VRGGKNAIELQLETLKACSVPVQLESRSLARVCPQLERDVALQQQEEATAELERILELLQTIEV